MNTFERLEAEVKKQGSVMAFVSDDRFGWDYPRGTTGLISKVHSAVWGWQLQFIPHGTGRLGITLRGCSALCYLHIPAIHHIQA